MRKLTSVVLGCWVASYSETDCLKEGKELPEKIILQMPYVKQRENLPGSDPRLTT